MTTVRSVVSDRSIRIDDNLPREVCISLGSEIVDLDRAEFLAAVATELDVIVIDRADLPPITVSLSDPRKLRVGDVTVYDSADPATLRDYAYDYLALAEHLEAHPPIDEAQVDALASILGDFAIADEHNGTRDDRQLARLLAARGVRAPQAGDDQ